MQEVPPEAFPAILPCPSGCPHVPLVLYSPVPSTLHRVLPSVPAMLWVPADPAHPRAGWASLHCEGHENEMGKRSHITPEHFVPGSAFCPLWSRMFGDWQLKGRTENLEIPSWLHVKQWLLSLFFFFPWEIRTTRSLHREAWLSKGCRDPWAGGAAELQTPVTLYRVIFRTCM